MVVKEENNIPPIPRIRIPEGKLNSRLRRYLFLCLKYGASIEPCAVAKTRKVDRLSGLIAIIPIARSI